MYLVRCFPFIPLPSISVAQHHVNYVSIDTKERLDCESSLKSCYRSIELVVEVL
jgi:hypothetical protein